MRRDVLIEAIDKIIIDLQDSGLAGMFTDALNKFQQQQGTKDMSNWVSIPIAFDFMRRASEYSVVEKQILEIFNLDQLANANIWQHEAFEYDPSFIFRNDNSLKFFLNHAPKILQLLKRDHDNRVGQHTEDKDGLLLQRVILTDEGDSLSSPERLIELLQSFSQIYRTIAKIEGISEDTLAVVSIDSGSEKSFDFIGIGKLMQEVRECLQTVYNMVAFHRQNVTTRNLQVATESLAVLQKVKSLEDAEAIDGEQANRFRHAIVTGLERFAGTGAYTPEMNITNQPPAALLRPQQRLLTGPVNEIARETHAQNVEAAVSSSNEVDRSEDFSSFDEEFTEEQIRSAISLLSATSKLSDREVSSEKNTASTKRLPRRRPSTKK